MPMVPMVGFAIFFDSRRLLAAGVSSQHFFSAIELHAPQVKTLEFVEARPGFISAALIDVSCVEAIDSLLPALQSLARQAGIELYCRPNPVGSINIRENQGRFFNGLLEVPVKDFVGWLSSLTRVIEAEKAFKTVGIDKPTRGFPLHQTGSISVELSYQDHSVVVVSPWSATADGHDAWNIKLDDAGAAVFGRDMRVVEADGALLSSTCDILRESAHDLWALLNFEELVLEELTRKPQLRAV